MRARVSVSAASRNCSATSISEVLTPVRSSQFKRDVRRARKRGKDLRKLRRLLASLVMQQPLSARHRDHPLRGIWKGYREAHVEADWLVI